MNNLKLKKIQLSSTKKSPKKRIVERGPDGVKNFNKNNGDGSKEYVYSGDTDVEQLDPNKQNKKVGHMDLPTSDDNNNQ